MKSNTVNEVTKKVIILTLSVIILLCPILWKVNAKASEGDFIPFDKPLAVTPTMGTTMLTQTLIDTIVTELESGNYTGYPYNEHGFGADEINLLLFSEYNSSGNYITLYAFKDGYISDFSWPSDYNTGSNMVTFRSLGNYLLRFDYDFDESKITYVTSTTGNCILPFYALGNNLCWIENLMPSQGGRVIPDIPVYACIEQKNIRCYPLYLRDGEMSFGGDVIFKSGRPTQTDDETARLIQNFIDLYGDIDQLPQVDESTETGTGDSLTLKLIKQYTKGTMNGVQAAGLFIAQTITDSNKSLGDKIETLFDAWLNGIKTELNEIKTIIVAIGVDLHKIAEENDPQIIASEWKTGYSTSAVKSMQDLGDRYKGTLSTIGTRNTGRLVFGNWRLEYNGNDLHLYGDYITPEIFGETRVQQDISFAWYNQCRDYVTKVINVFLIIAFAWNVFVRLPGIIQGVGSKGLEKEK